jgi:predicted membrane protein
MNIQILKTLPKREIHLSLVVILLAWGGIALAVLLQYVGIISNAGYYPWGCVLASFVISYLAYIKPHRDIVTLCTPICAILIFFGLEAVEPSVLLHIVYAITLMIMLLRLHFYFSKKATKEGIVRTPEEEAELDRIWEEKMRR